MSENHEHTQRHTPRDWVITKRQLGLLLMLAGGVGLVGILGLDILRGGALDFGPMQLLALAGSAVLAIIGLTLLPLGGKPA